MISTATPPRIEEDLFGLPANDRLRRFDLPAQPGRVTRSSRVLSDLARSAERVGELRVPEPPEPRAKPRRVPRSKPTRLPKPTGDSQLAKTGKVVGTHVLKAGKATGKGVLKAGAATAKGTARALANGARKASAEFKRQSRSFD